GPRELAITVKAVEGGRVSQHLVNHAQPGELFRLWQRSYSPTGAGTARTGDHRQGGRGRPGQPASGQPCAAGRAVPP
ncbi:hypothetical protein C7E12_22455, partial [Stenotrophomonas maltophilia]